MLKRFFFTGLILAMTAALAGCAVISIPFFPTTQTMEERVIEGTGKNKILIIDVSGFISEKKRSATFHDGTSLIEDIREMLLLAGDDDRVKGLILRINSPGGTMTGSDIIHHELTRFKAKRNIPVIACLMAVGTSGAYYIANAAETIIAHPTTITGSISVIAMRFNVRGLLDIVGIKEETIKSGNLKDIWSPFRPSTEEERAIMQTLINRYHMRFIDIVQAGRKSLSRQDIEKAADGRIYTAYQALEMRLVDRIGYLDDAIDMIKHRLGLDEARIIMYGRPGSFKNSIYAGVPATTPRTINLFNIESADLLAPSGLHFMYVWTP